MTEPVKVLIQWTSEKKAGLPPSGVYSTVAKFEEDTCWPAEAWSLVIEFQPSQNADVKGPFEATARFLAPSGPWERLKTGRVFELYEGANPTAKVTVL